MALQAANKPTAAESALIEAYSHQIGTMPGDGNVLAARDRLFDELKRGGLPTRRMESWHYTDLKTLLRGIPANDVAASAAPVAPLIAGSLVLTVAQGRALKPSALPAGLGVTRLADGLTEGMFVEGLVPYDREDAIGRLNGSFVSDGFALTIEPGTALDAPVELQSVHGAGQVHCRFPVSIGAGAKAVLVERHQGSGEGAALISSVSDLTIGDGAEVTWVIVQAQGADDTHLGQVKLAIGADAQVRLVIVNAGGKLVRQEVHAVTKGEGSDFKLRTVNLLGGDTHTDVTMTLGHDLANTTSTEIIRNVVFDRARGVFQGQIRVAQDAQKTDARMACNTLLLTDDGEFSVKPELEIFADDVQCAHGATVADIDRNHLYYMMARGIPEKKARGLLVNAFLAEIVEELEDEPLVEALEAIIFDWLDRHG